MTAYQKALDWLYALEAAKGMDFKLERVALALELLGHPHRAYPCVHIAGTNGKGSVAATLHAVLTEAGHRVGLYTSPHLERLNERIRIGAAEISDDEVVDLTGEIQREATSCGIELTFFELTTVMAFLAFARHGIDVGVIETGLGGRLDATNVVDPIVSVITNIGYDHAEFLGATLEGIAREKGGIIKPERPLVLGEMRSTALRVLRGMARERRAPVTEVTRDCRWVEGEPARFTSPGFEIDGIEMSLRGAFQRRNAAVALATLGIVRDRLPFDSESVRRGLRNVRWPGRFEIFPGTPDVVLDGAHNFEGMQALVDELRSSAAGRRVHVVFAVMRDKPWRRMIDLLAPLCASAIVTEVMPPRGLAAVEAARRFARSCRVAVEPDPRRAFARALETAAATEVVLVAGSLFLVGAVRAMSQNRTAERTPAVL